MSKETRHEGRFIAGPDDRIVRDDRNLADLVEDWLNPHVAFRGGEQANPITVFKNIMEDDPSKIPFDQQKRISDALAKHERHLTKLKESLEARIKRRMKELSQ